MATLSYEDRARNSGMLECRCIYECVARRFNVPECVVSCLTMRINVTGTVSDVSRHGASHVTPVPTPTHGKSVLYVRITFAIHEYR